MSWAPVGEVSIVYLGNPVTSSFAPTWLHTRVRMDVIGPDGVLITTVEGNQGASLRWDGTGGVLGTSYRLEQYAMAPDAGGGGGGGGGDGGGGGHPTPLVVHPRVMEQKAAGGGGAMLVLAVIGVYLLIRGR
jgi:hypothetical protein